MLHFDGHPNDLPAFTLSGFEFNIVVRSSSYNEVNVSEKKEACFSVLNVSLT